MCKYKHPADGLGGHGHKRGMNSVGLGGISSQLGWCGSELDHSTALGLIALELA